MTAYRLITLGGLTLLDGEGVAVSALGPRNLALLAYLALATKPMSRDHVAELFWGDRDEDRARHSMREALSKLRQLLGPDAIPQRSTSVVLSASAPVSVDARALAAASIAGDTRSVVALYGGPFLNGIHAGGARSFEDWSDAERSAYEVRFIAACVPECARLRESGAWTECAELARRWLDAAPLDPKPALELLHALAAPGTLEAQRVAMREYHRFVDRLAADYEIAPHRSVTAAADNISRLTFAPPIDEPVVIVSPSLDIPAAIPADVPVTPALPPEQSAGPIADVASELNALPPLLPPLPPPSDTPPVRRRTARRRLTRYVAATAAAAAIIALGVLLRNVSSRRTVATDNGALAIMPFEVVGQERDAWLGTGLPRLLGAAVAREHVVNVVDQARMHELLPASDVDHAPLPTAALSDAHKLGARWLLTGSVSVGGGRYWLDASLRDTRTDGARTRRVTVADTALDAIIAQVTARLVASIDAPDGGAQFAELEPNTVPAYRLYIRALQLRAQMRPAEAAAALDAAIASDSGFVDAVIERRYMLAAPFSTAAIDSARALDAAYARGRLHAPEFERLYFDAYLALHNGDHARAEVLGRSLLARYPNDPRSYFRAIDILSLHGRFAEATAVALRAIAVDSAGRTAGSDECRVCIGYRAVSEMARVTGDFARAESAARHAIAFRPDDPAAWAQLGAVLAAQGRYDEALSASHRAASLAPTAPEFAMDPVRRLIEARRYDEADSALRVWRSTDDPGFAESASEMRVLLLRERGEFAAAARVLNDALKRYPSDSSWMLLVQGENSAHVGDITGVKRAFVAAVPPNPFPNVADPASRYPADWARTFTWPRTLLADALWEAGERDTVSLASRADSIQAIGTRSYYARDWRLYHHVRGLIAMAGRRWPEAESEFGKARWGRSGWPRTLVELAHAQLAEGHTSDALATLRDAYTAQLDAMGRYVPRSQLDLEMAQTFVAAHQMDSARVYADYAASAWRNADPSTRLQLASLPTSVTRPQQRAR